MRSKECYRKTQHGEKLHDVRGRDQSDAVASQGMPRIASNHQKVARGKEGFSPLRGGWTALLTP